MFLAKYIITVERFCNKLLQTEFNDNQRYFHEENTQAHKSQRIPNIFMLYTKIMMIYEAEYSKPVVHQDCESGPTLRETNDFT